MRFPVIETHVYPSSEDTVRRNLYVSAVMTCSLLDKIMKTGTSKSKTECAHSLINEHIIICLVRVIAQTVAEFSLRRSSFNSSMVHCGVYFLSGLLYIAANISDYMQSNGRVNGEK
jgi:hypothetical protein